MNLQKQGIAEFGYEKFKQNVISSYNQWVESTKKRPKALISVVPFVWRKTPNLIYSQKGEKKVRF